MPNQLPAIKHIVQLMLETDHSTKCLDFLYAADDNKSAIGQPFEGLTGDESDPDDTGKDIKKAFRIDHIAKHGPAFPGKENRVVARKSNIKMREATSMTSKPRRPT